MTELHIAARRYLGTPFRHRGRDLAGIDCVGLAILAARDCGWQATDLADYTRHPKGGLLEQMLSLNCGAPVDDMRPGDLVAMRFSKNAPIRHVAIVGDHKHGLSLIHTDSYLGRVVEQRIDPTISARIAAVYRRSA
jgi:cell wall-associated NlpC family hydrolase